MSPSLEGPRNREMCACALLGFWIACALLFAIVEPRPHTRWGCGVHVLWTILAVPMGMLTGFSCTHLFDQAVAFFLAWFATVMSATVLTAGSTGKTGLLISPIDKSSG